MKDSLFQSSLHKLIDFTHVIRIHHDAKRQPCCYLATIVLPIPACKQFCSFIAFCLSLANGTMHAKHRRGASWLRVISSFWRKGSIWAKNIGDRGTGWRRLLRESENGVSGAHVHRCVGMARDEVRFFCSFPRFTALISHPKVLASLNHSSMQKPLINLINSNLPIQFASSEGWVWDWERLRWHSLFYLISFLMICYRQILHCLFVVTNNMGVTVLLFRQALGVCLELACTT